MFSLHFFSSFYYLSLAIDIAIISVLIYYILSFFSSKSLIRFIIIIAAFSLIFLVSSLLKLQLVLWVIQKILFILPFAVLVIFQQEIKKFVMHGLGRNVFQHFFKTGKTNTTHYSKILEALETLSKNKIGALIVVSRISSLEFFKLNAIKINSEISPQLLLTIFTPPSPLHDGAVFIENNKISVAGAFVPISEKSSRLNLGSRHRAAIGVTEESDAIAIVVSEETGNVSLCLDGEIEYDLSAIETVNRVKTLLGVEDENS